MGDKYQFKQKMVKQKIEIEKKTPAIVGAGLWQANAAGVLAEAISITTRVGTALATITVAAV